MLSKRLVADRGRGSKRKKKASLFGWFCNPQVLNAVIAGARFAVTLARLVLELVKVIGQH